MNLHSEKSRIALLVIILFSVFFLNNSFLDPTIMEARNYITAREMVQHDNYLVPTMNGYPRLAKPPLPTWVTVPFIKIGGAYNLRNLRLPSAFIASLLIFFLYKVTRRINPDDKILPFIVAAVATTSFYITYLGRQNTWDIFCHSFMLGVIWLWLEAWKGGKNKMLLFSISGVLMGFAFLSKGPIPFVALLIPFLLAYRYGYGFSEMRESWKGILLSVVICIIISAAWPLYVSLFQSDALHANVKTEVEAWSSRHVRPFYQYWSFPIQSGVWTILIAASLIVPYAKSRLRNFGNYKFLAAWVFVTIIILSLSPEKKERYLMPALIPMALIGGTYIRYLISQFEINKSTKIDRVILITHGLIVGLAGILIPIALIYLEGPTGIFLWTSVVFFLLLGIGILYFTIKLEPHKIFLGTVFMMVLFTILIIPQFNKILLTFNPKYEMISDSEVVAKKNDLEFYALDGLKPEQIWDLGKVVDTLHIRNGHLELPAQKEFILFSERIPEGYENLKQELNIQPIDTLPAHRSKPDRFIYVFYVNGSVEAADAK